MLMSTLLKTDGGLLHMILCDTEKLETESVT